MKIKIPKERLKRRFDPEHWEDLRKSGLNETTIRSAKIYSVPSWKMKEKLGAVHSKVKSALAFPYDEKFERFRLYPPLLNSDGHSMKYFQRRGSPVRLFIPSNSRRHIYDPSRVLHITEGEKKALKASQEGLCCVGLGGIWNFKRKGGSGLIDDFKEIPLKNRKVFIVPDSDFKANTNVSHAVKRMGIELRKLGAKVRVVLLPTFAGEKIGLDDFLVDKDKKEFFSLERISLDDEVFQISRLGNPYVVRNNEICIQKNIRENSVIESLSNFSAKAVAEVVHDNGEEKSSYLKLVGVRSDGSKLPEICVPLSEFSSMRWVTKHWGFQTIVRAGQSRIDQLREAIQRLSPELTKELIFTHTGWREISSAKVFLHSEGALGDKDVKTQLDIGLERYRLPSEWSKVDVKSASKQARNFLDIADPIVTVPLFSAMHLAPFSTALNLDFTLWLLGATGTLKSTIAALLLSFFGEFDRTTLPGSWDSTDNALGKKCFILKDLPFVIDDFSPPSNLEMARIREKQAERIIRSVGNNSGRDRLKSDLSSRITYRPRCFLIVTGEQLPTGQSLLARICAVSILRDSIRKDKLTDIQRNVSVLPIYTADYIARCSPKYDQVVSEAKQSFLEMRSLYQSKGHSRIPEILAWLRVGFDMGLRNLSRFYGDTVIRMYEKEGHKALLKIERHLANFQKEERESFKFLETIWSLLRQRELSLSLGVSNCIGWSDTEYLYLRPKPSYNSVCKYFRNENSHFGLKMTMLNKMLSEDGLLVKSNEENRYATKESNPNNVQERVLKLPLNKLEGLLGPLPK